VGRTPSSAQDPRVLLAFLTARANQNLNRTLICTDLGPPAWKIGANPLLGLPVPSIKFSIEVDCPNNGLAKNRIGSANSR